MKILVARTSDGTLGGAERAAYDHARAFARLGHRVVFVSNNRQLLAAAQKSSITAYRSILPARSFGFLTKLVLAPLTWLQYAVLALLVRPDIINPQGREEHVGFTLSAWLHRRAVVWKDAGDLVRLIKPNRSSALAKLNQRILIAALKRADAIYTLNESERLSILASLTQLGNKLDPGRISVIPSSIMFDDYDLKARPPKTTDKLVIGTVIRLDKHKGVQYLLAAANKLAYTVNDLEFWVVGGGPYRAELEKIAKPNVDVTFWGHQDDISPYLNRIDIFVQPAEIEGWGRNVKEAMYFGKPVVGSKTGGIAVQIDDGKTGLLFAPKDSDGLSKQILRLVKDSRLRQKLGGAGRAKALAEGDYVTLIKSKIIPLFEEVLAKRR